MVDNIRRNRAYGIRNALQKLDTLPIVAQRDPSNTDFRYPIGQHWINQTNNSAYILTSITASLPNWEILGSSGSSTISLYIVAPDGSTDYPTIQSALDAANAAGIPATVVVRAGNYTENLTLYSLIDIQGNINTGVFIIGTHTPPLGGRIKIENCTLSDGTNILSSIAAGSTAITIENCIFNITAGVALDLTSWTGDINVFNCTTIGANDGFINTSAGAAPINVINSRVGTSAGTFNIGGGNIIFRNSDFRCAGTFGGLVIATIDFCELGGTISTTIDAEITIANSTFITGAATAISHGSTRAMRLSELVINTSNPAITGAGTGIITIGSITFENNNTIAAGLTLSNLPKLAISGLKMPELPAASAPFGLAILVAGTVTVNTTVVVPNSKIFLTSNTTGAAPGFLHVSGIAAGVSFTITSSNGADTSVVAWLIINNAN